MACNSHEEIVMQSNIFLFIDMKGNATCGQKYPFQLKRFSVGRFTTI